MTGPASPAAAASRAVVVVVPIYRATLSPLEHFTLTHSLRQLRPGRRVVFVGPEGLDLSLYRAACGPLLRRAGGPGPSDIEYLPFAPASFASIPGYSRLLMSAPFYQAFARHEFMLVLQTDALLLRDELDAWCQRPFDYVGAPWPDGVEIMVNLDRHTGPSSQRVKAMVGNGGFSLRRNRACIELLDEFPQALDYFQRSGSSEDLFFGVLGALSTRFVLPNEMTAARFARELQPARYQRIHQAPPMGGHAWWKYDPGYWLAQLPPDAAERARALLRAAASPTAVTAAAAPATSVAVTH